MSDHYYTNQPTSKSEPNKWQTSVNGMDFTFHTDSGVFSKNSIDYGSRVLIETIDVTELPEGKILDLGCGYGTIGLILAKQNPDRIVEMVDVNERALSLAKKNASVNQVGNVEIHASSIYDEVEEEGFAGIVSNPPIRAGKEVVHQILKEAKDHLKVDGVLTIVIRKKQGAPSAKKKMKEVFGNVERLTQDKGYWILQSYKID